MEVRDGKEIAKVKKCQKLLAKERLIGYNVDECKVMSRMK
jgi:hypothetical protein